MLDKKSLAPECFSWAFISLSHKRTPTLLPQQTPYQCSTSMIKVSLVFSGDLEAQPLDVKEC